jgi:hypothetical protein
MWTDGFSVTNGPKMKMYTKYAKCEDGNNKRKGTKDMK